MQRVAKREREYSPLERLLMFLGSVTLMGIVVMILYWVPVGAGTLIDMSRNYENLRRNVGELYMNQDYYVTRLHALEQKCGGRS